MKIIIEVLTMASFLSDAWNIIKNILIFVLVLGLIVGIHEFGHFIFARRAGILCREFAIGMGPKLWSKRKGETVYALRAIPIGGFCAIAGEEVEDDPFKDVKKIKLDIRDGVIKGFYLNVDDEKINYPVYEIVRYDIFDSGQTGNLYMEVVNPGDEETITTTYNVDPQAIIYLNKSEFQIAPFNRTLGSKSKTKRALVMFGGPLMNFVLALFVFLIVGLCSGFANTKSNAIGEVSENPSATAIIKNGDKIYGIETTTIGKKDIASWTEFSNYMSEYDSKDLSEDVTLYIDRDGNKLTITLTPVILINNAGFGSTYDYNKTNKIVVGEYQDITQDGISDNSALQKDDIITAIWTNETDKITNPTWSDIRRIFDNYVGGDKDEANNKVYMTITRGSETLNIDVTPYSKELIENQSSLTGTKVDPTSQMIGLSPTYKFSIIKSVGYSFERTWGSFTDVLGTLKLLFGGAVSIKNLSGPIGIYSLTSDVAKRGILYVLSLIGLLSVNIGFLNLLPIPALDGGRLVFVAYEAITKKKPNPKVETILITITMLLLFGLMIFVAYEDIIRLFTK